MDKTIALIYVVLCLNVNSAKFFEKIANGRLTDNFIIKEYKDISQIQCAHRCIRHEECKSYGVNAVMKKCLLYKENISNRIHLVPDDSWVLYSNKAVEVCC